MTRLEISEGMRRLRAEESRSPVDAAFYAICCLCNEQKRELSDRFNQVFEKCSPPQTLKFTEAAE